MELKGSPLTPSPSIAPAIIMPDGATDIQFTLKEVRILGATAFTREQLDDIYTPYINHTISLADVYVMAEKITERYRNAGYFLSLAYLPNQKIDDGTVIFQVIEGYVGAVDIPESLKAERLIAAQIDRLSEQKPLSAKALESFLLRLNDLPGFAVSGTISVLENAKDGAVMLTLKATDAKGKGQISFDNFSSRFLGPNEVSASYTQSLLPMHETTISALTGLPTDKLKYATLAHKIAILPDIALEFNASYTDAAPGYRLETFDIESDSLFMSASINYQWIRQRQENLSLTATIDSRNSNTNLLNSPFSRDRIRALRVGANYDIADDWLGYNMINAKLSKGLEVLGSSKKGDSNLSRMQADPHFTKAELSMTRLQGINDGWSVLMSTSGQIASGPLFSSEEFGYGGQSFGRAFDASEISGDHGVSASMEIRYTGWNVEEIAKISPYAFYDIGTVWNDDVAQVKRESGASAGFGTRIVSDIGLSANAGLAWPLTRDISAPLYGETEKDPRVLLQITQGF